MPENELPPFSVEAIHGVIGSMLIDPAVCVPVAGKHLRANQLRLPALETIFALILAMYAEGVPADSITLTQRLREIGKLDAVGGPAFVSGFITQTPTSANLEHYIEIVRDDWQRFQTWKTCRKIVSECLSANPVAIQSISADLSRLQTDLSPQNDVGWRTMAELVHERLESFEAASLRKPDERAPDIYPTGIKALDAQIEGGLALGDYVVFTAKTSGGKSALAGQIAVELAVNQKAQVMIASYEMSAKQLVDRMITLKSSIPGPKLRKGQMDEYEFARLQRGATSLAGSGIHIRDRIGRWTVDDVANAARAIKAQHGLHLLVVDYVQLIRNASANRRSGEVENTSRALIELAKDENIIVIGLSQLNKEGGTFQSATIGFDADLAINIEATEPADKYRRILTINKNRNGERDIPIEVAWHPTLTKFS